MTAAGGGPALSGTGAGHAPAGLTARSRAPRLRTVLALATVEASLLVRSVLALAGLLAGAAVIWLLARSAQPLWWRADWEIGAGQFVLGMAVLVSAQLAAGRPRRDAMAGLYASFPATAGTRTLAHLAGLAGAVPASLLLLGAAAAVIEVRGAIGAPSIAVLAGGLLLVIAAGAAGIAIGTRFAHPLAGVLGAVALFSTSATSHLASGGGIWLLPWEILQDQLGSLPGRLAGYPPAGAHALELAGLAVLAGVVALAVAAGRARPRAWLAAAGVAAVAVICLAGALQLRPVPAAGLNHLVSEVADPASAQRCASAGQVRYCLYPGFGSLLPSLEAPVNQVLAHLPARPARPLTVRQVVPLDLDSTLTHGHPGLEVSRWDARLQRAPGSDGAAPASAIYLPVGDWPAAGGQLADAHFDLALAAAEWAAGLPGTGGIFNSSESVQCVPLDQAREAVAIWLAILATRPPAGELQAGLGGLETGRGFHGVQARGTMVPTWNYPGEGGSYVTPPGGGAEDTAAGYLLANAMTSLPQQKVSQVLRSAWGRWLNWRTTDAQLAAALGIRMPGFRLPPPLRPGFTPPPGTTAGNADQPGPQTPVCAS